MGDAPRESDQATTFRSIEVLARSLHLPDAELQPTLDAIAARALDVVTPARYAGLILVQRGRLIPQVTTGRPVHLLDALQQKLGDGPCMNAATTQEVNRIDDMGCERRWPAFVAEAAQLGVCSLLCVPLWVDERSLGTLSLYAEKPRAFDDHAEQVSTILATLAALALAGAQRAEQLQAALANRDVIGQAKGILMERHRLTSDAAFAQLADASQRANSKLTVIAEHLVATGELPG